MKIKQLRYLNDRTIIVLYEIGIYILEIGYNFALVVRQILKFNDQS
jgi:hypothetical protein